MAEYDGDAVVNVNLIFTQILSVDRDTTETFRFSN